MDTVFDVFEEVPYTFLKVSRGGVYGNMIQSTYLATGVFKRRDEMIQINNQELRQAASTLHIHPDESFIADITVDGEIQFVGNGVSVDGIDYKIVGDTAGTNFDDGQVEHYTLTLQTTDYTDYNGGTS